MREAADLPSVAVGRAWARCVGRLQRLNFLGDMVRHVLRCRAMPHLVGEVVKLRERLKWFEETLEGSNEEELETALALTG